MTKTFSNRVELFLSSAGALLLALGTALCISNQVGAGFVPPRDPILMIGMPKVFWIVGLLALGVGWFCLFGRQTFLMAALIMWLSLNAIVYQMGLIWLAGPRSFNGYWGNVAEAFSMPPNTVHWMIMTGSVYLFAGSVAVLFYLRATRGMPDLSADKEKEGHFKIPCSHCGGRIDFTADRVGQTLPCPHCSLNITLKKPGTVKTACYFCKGHFEFPTHALGTKMPCPHCKKDITLIEPKPSVA